MAMEIKITVDVITESATVIIDDGKNNAPVDDYIKAYHLVKASDKLNKRILDMLQHTARIALEKAFKKEDNNA